MKAAEKLTKDQELELGRRIQNKLLVEEQIKDGANVTPEMKKIIRSGEIAANSLVASNVKLVHDEAHKQRRKMPALKDHEEVFAQGMLGLWKAALKYDPTKNNKFSTVATHWIRQSIQRETNRTHRLVRLPENRIENFSKIMEIRRRFDETNVSPGEIEEIIAKELNLKKSKIHEIMNAAGAHASLNKKVGDSEESTELAHYVMDCAESAESDVMNNEMSSILNLALAQLDSLEMEVVSSAFKMDIEGFENKTVRQICEDHKITTSEYRKISTGAMKKIRAYLDSYGVEFPDFF